MIKKLKIFNFLVKDIKKLEKFFLEFADSLDGILKEAIVNTLMVKGKRIRPILFLVCAKNKNYNIDYLLPAAASIEIIHTASLIHDDVIDRSFLRRGKKTIHNIYDKETAKFVGNYLFTHTFCLLNKYNSSEILREMSAASQNLVKGEFDQLKTKKDLKQNTEIYFKKIGEKTSSLFKLSCALGGILSNSTKEDIERMKKFGEYLGISFQINDDLLDINPDRLAGKVRKLAGNDIKQGNVTLPLIYALRDTEFKKIASPILSKQKITDKEVVKIINMISKTGAVRIARKKFDYYLEKAKEVADSIKGADRRACLVKICDSINMEV